MKMIEYVLNNEKRYREKFDAEAEELRYLREINADLECRVQTKNKNTKKKRSNKPT